MEHTVKRIQTLVAEQAAEWVIRLEDATARERAQFSEWLTASPNNVAEFLNARATWEAMTGTAFERVPETETLLALLKSDAAVDNLSSIAFPGQRKHIRVALAAGLATLALGIGLSLWVIRPLDPQHAVYESSVGEQITRSLPDGSTVVLNTRTRVRMDWSEQHRDVHLDAGEAFFDVARDPVRPFRVWADGSVIRVVGTRFNVQRGLNSITVTVLEGRVAIDEADSTTKEGIQLKAGEEGRIESANKVSTRQLAEPARAVAWQARRLIFEGESLSQVVAEFNRYNEKPLKLGEPSLGTKRIHGVFDAKDRESLIEFLEAFENVTVEKRADALIVRSRAPR